MCLSHCADPKASQIALANTADKRFLSGFTPRDDDDELSSSSGFPARTLATDIVKDPLHSTASNCFSPLSAERKTRKAASVSF